jgi:hypothetical protein
MYVRALYCCIVPRVAVTVTACIAFIQSGPHNTGVIPRWDYDRNKTDSGTVAEINFHAAQMRFPTLGLLENITFKSSGSQTVLRRTLGLRGHAF